MLVLGVARRRLCAAIPALLKTRFGANEILTSLMLVYVAQLLLDWLVRGPWRDPQGFNFPKTVSFDGLADAADCSAAHGATSASLIALVVVARAGGA